MEPKGSNECVIIFGRNRENLNFIHSVVREMLWGLLWHLSRQFVDAFRRGVEGEDKQLEILGKVGTMVMLCGDRVTLEKASGALLNIFLGDKREQAELLIGLATAISDSRSRIVHLPIQFVIETGAIETAGQAAKRLLTEATRHYNPIIVESREIYARRAVKTGILSEMEALAAIGMTESERSHKLAVATA